MLPATRRGRRRGDWPLRDVRALAAGTGSSLIAGRPSADRRATTDRDTTMAVLVATAGPLTIGTLAGQALGMLCRAFGAAALNITLSLYVMDYIRKRDLVRSEPLKLMFSAVAWAAGPLLGVALQKRFGQGAAEL